MTGRPVPALLREAAAQSRASMPAPVAEPLAVLLEATADQDDRLFADLSRYPGPHAVWCRRCDGWNQRPPGWKKDDPCTCRDAVMALALAILTPTREAA